jgi:hypothetical protein
MRLDSAKILHSPERLRVSQPNIFGAVGHRFSAKSAHDSGGSDGIRARIARNFKPRFQVRMATAVWQMRFEGDGIQRITGKTPAPTFFLRPTIGLKLFSK